MSIREKLATVFDHNSAGILKGARLILAYGAASALSIAIAEHTHTDLRSCLSLTTGMALWACVSEAAPTLRRSLGETVALVVAGAAAASLVFSLSAHSPHGSFRWSQCLLVVGAFFVAACRGYGLFFAGLGSQIYIGFLLALGCTQEFPWRFVGPLIFVAALVAALVPQLLLHPRHKIAGGETSGSRSSGWDYRQSCAVGLQAAVPAIVILIAAAQFHLREPAWAITAAAYVVSIYSSGTASRIRQRLLGTVVGVPLGLLFLTIAPKDHIVIWGCGAAGMLLYAVSLPRRYDVACASYAFVLMLTMIANGERSLTLLASRIAETLLGCALTYIAMIALAPLPKGTVGCAKEPQA